MGNVLLGACPHHFMSNKINLPKTWCVPLRWVACFIESGRAVVELSTGGWEENYHNFNGASKLHIRLFQWVGCTEVFLNISQLWLELGLCFCVSVLTRTQCLYSNIHFEHFSQVWTVWSVLPPLRWPNYNQVWFTAMLFPAITKPFLN